MSRPGGQAYYVCVGEGPGVPTGLFYNPTPVGLCATAKLRRMLSRAGWCRTAREFYLSRDEWVSKRQADGKTRTQRFVAPSRPRPTAASVLVRYDADGSTKVFVADPNFVPKHAHDWDAFDSVQPRVTGPKAAVPLFLALVDQARTLSAMLGG